MSTAVPPTCRCLKAFFPFFGGKHNLSKWYPEPHHEAVLEPFAGSAGYAHRYWQRKVRLNDADPVIVGVWDFLIRSRPKDIRRLPLLEPGQLVSDLRVCQEAKWLIGFWCYRGATEPRNKLASWAQKWPNRFWSEHIRTVIANQVGCIDHWQITEGPATALPNQTGTWFVDPPYTTGGTHYRVNGVDFHDLRRWVLGLDGQVIVCERTGAEWLPGHHGTREHRTQQRHNTMKGRTSEAYWHAFDEGPRYVSSDIPFKVTRTPQGRWRGYVWTGEKQLHRRGGTRTEVIQKLQEALKG